MRFTLFAAWCVAIWFAARLGEAAGADDRIAFTGGAFAFMVLYTIHCRLTWERVRDDD